MKVMILLLDGYNGNVKVEADVIGTIVPNNNRWGLTNGWKIIEVYEEEEHDGGDRQRP